MRHIRRFARDRGGNFAIITGLLAVPLIGVSGLAVDYSRATNARQYLQTQSDNIAIAVSSKGPQETNTALFKTMSEFAKSGSVFPGVTIEGSWINVSDYRVTSTVDVPLTLGAVVPGVEDTMQVQVVSVSRYQGARLKYKPPTYKDLSPEAGDYNMISAYCYSSATGRSQFVDIADNEGKDFGADMPTCKAGEVLSYLLSNVEGGRNNGGAKTLREKGKKTRDETYVNGTNKIYYYYTDTILEDKKERYDLGGLNLLETIVCDTRADCESKDKGGILPNNHQTGREHTRKLSEKACEKGKFMYYGWEDRPPGKSRGSDADFDDIRLVIECPEEIIEAYENVSLIQ